MNKIRFKSCYYTESTSPEEVFLFSEKTTHLLEGRLYVLINPYLQGEGSYEDEIIEKLERHALPEEIYYALERLKRRGYLQESPSAFSKEVSAFCDLAEVSSLLAKERLQTTTLFISNLSQEPLEPVLNVLKELEVSLTENSEKADLCVFLVTNYLDPRLKEWNARASKPWILAKLTGSELWIGPLFEKKSTGCWECLAERLKINRLEEAYVKAQNKDSSFSISIAKLPTTYGMGCHLLATELFKWIILQGKSGLKGKIVSWNSLELKLQEHHLTRLPDCLFCGKKNIKKPKSLQLLSRKKTGIEDGGYRCFSPEYTLDKYAYHISPISGAVHSLSPLLDNKSFSGIHVYKAGHNLAISNIEKGIHPSTLRSCSGGKGKTQMQAKASCLCEALERFSGTYRGYEVDKTATFKEIKKEALFPPDLILFSENQYQKRKLANKTAESFHIIPEPFDENRPLAWTSVWSLTEKTYKYVPTAYCYYAHKEKVQVCRADSNGNAAGNTLEEAILQGFFELIERDCVAMWWYNRISHAGVELTSFQEPFFMEVLAEYDKISRDVWVLDITNDLNIPTFVALSKKRQKKEEILMGFGSHFDPKIAIGRALAELNQMLITHLSLQTKNDLPTLNIALYLQWVQTATCAREPYLVPSNTLKTKKASDYQKLETDDLLTDIHLCQKIVESRGMEMLVLNQTRPEIDLAVVKVIVPGLRHFWNRFAPGRLYDVPVQLGWLKKPLKEAELNPIFMFL